MNDLGVGENAVGERNQLPRLWAKAGSQEKCRPVCREHLPIPAGIKSQCAVLYKWTGRIATQL